VAEQGTFVERKVIHRASHIVFILLNNMKAYKDINKLARDIRFKDEHKGKMQSGYD
jgi:hypothetical protein